MYQPLSSVGLGSLYQDAGRSTVEQTNPPEHAGPAAAVAHNAGGVAGQLAGLAGIELPALIALGVLAVVLVRYYD